MKERTTVVINRLEFRNNELEQMQAVSSTQLAQVMEDHQITASQVLAYKKQVDSCKRELEDERRRAQLLQERIDALNGLQEEMSRLRAEVHSASVFMSTELLFIRCAYLCQNDRLQQQHVNDGNYQMENTRANRVEEELDNLRGQYRELEKMNAQLKSSNQVY